MATSLSHPGRQGSYKSPYNFVSTYDKRPILDQQGMKVPDTTRDDKPPAHNPTSSLHPVGAERAVMGNGSQKIQASNMHRRRDTLQEQKDFAASRNPSNRSDDDDDYFSDMQELLSGTWPKSIPASADPNGDNHDGFIDIDELLSGRQQKGPASVDSDRGGIAQIVDNGTRGSNPTSSSRSTARSSRDPIIISDDESANAGSKTDCSNLEVDLITENNSSAPHVVDHQDDANNSGVVDGATLQLAADLPMSASPSHGSVTHPASPIRVNSEGTQGNASYDDLDVTKEAEDEGVDVVSDDKDDADTCTTRRSGSFAVSSHNPASDRDVSLSELWVGQHDSTQSLQPGLAVTSLEQSDLTNGTLPRHRPRQQDTKNVRPKRLRTPALTGPARTARPVSAALESNDFKHTQPAALLAASGKEREICDTDHEMADDGESDDSNDGDYDVMNDAAASEMRRPSRSRKRVKRVKDRELNEVETPSTQSLNVSCQATAATSTVSMQESEEIPIRGYLTLKTIESKVMYCLTFSQELFPKSGGTSQRQGVPRSVSSSSDVRKSEKMPAQEEATNRHVKKSQFSSEEDDLLVQKKEEGLSWDEISVYFPERTKGTLQVHYSTKLKTRSRTSKSTKKRRRSK